jgi:hypothetical protein
MSRLRLSHDISTFLRPKLRRSSLCTALHLRAVQLAPEVECAVRVNQQTAVLDRRKRQRLLGPKSCAYWWWQHSSKTRITHFWRASPGLACQKKRFMKHLHVRPLLLQIGPPVIIRSYASASPLSRGRLARLRRWLQGQPIPRYHQTAKRPLHTFWVFSTRDPGADVREAVPVGDGLLGARQGFSCEARAFCIRRGPCAPCQGDD